MVPYSFTHCHPGQHRLEWSGPRIRRTGARRVTGTARLRRCGRLAAQHSRSAIGMRGPAAPPQTSGRAAVPAVRSAGGSMTYKWEGRFLRARLCVVLLPRPAEGPRRMEPSPLACMWRRWGALFGLVWPQPPRSWLSPTHRHRYRESLDRRAAAGCPIWVTLSGCSERFSSG